MAISKIQKGDKVKVIAGKYKGKVGIVVKVNKFKKVVGGKTIFDKRLHLTIIPEIVKYKKSFKYNSEEYPGSQYLVPRPIHISNCAIVLDEKSGKTSKIYVKKEDGRKARFLKRNNEKVLSFLSEIKNQTTQEQS